MTANAAATAVITRRVPTARRRPRQSAHAPKHAAAAAEWPLGNDMPENGASGPIVGRGRLTMVFARLLARPTPSTVTARKTITPRDRVRTTSNAATTIVITITTFVLPRSVKRRRMLVLRSVACAAAHRATRRSARTTYDCRRTSKASAATATNMASATVSASPVTRAGLRRSRTKCATRSCATNFFCTASAVACTGPCVACSASRWTARNTPMASRAAIAPAATKTRSTAISTSRTAARRSSSREHEAATASRAVKEKQGS
jgi:hypothetical protein